MSNEPRFQDWIDENVPKTHLPWYWFMEIPEIAALVIGCALVLLCLALAAVFG